MAVGDPLYRHVRDLSQISPHQRLEIVHFFETYKLLEKKETDVVGWRDYERARDILLHDRDVYEKEQAAPGG
ncbi:MAG: inorganic diphosphatase [Candidatus Limnocylindrales bacterium]